MKQRIPETHNGIQGEFNVHLFDQFQKTMRDRGWIETKAIIQTGINTGHALEIGPGPGYLGLEWLKHTQATLLTALEISPDMMTVSKKNAKAYGFENRWKIREGSGEAMPFNNDELDAVFSTGSLHEWSAPGKTFQEIMRILKPGGRFFVGDLRRDIAWPVKWFLRITCKPKAIRPGLESSINAAYTPKEISVLLAQAGAGDCTVGSGPIGLTITGRK